MTNLADASPPRAACGIAPPPQAFAWPVRRPFLAAEWRNLILLNYKIDPAILAPYVPAGTELDYFDGKTFLSIVGFQFLDVRVFGLRVPCHVNFEEVNLRFYVRLQTHGGWRRGVVFIRELAPKWAVTTAARLLYGENYSCVPMSHAIAGGTEECGKPPTRVEYRWRFREMNCHVAAEIHPYASHPSPGSHEEFIIEHYWGYTARRRGRTSEYQVAHPPWRIAAATHAELYGDAARLYGPQFAPFLEAAPASAFWADGSAVQVYSGKRIAPQR